MTNFRRMFLFNLIALIILVGGGFVAYSFYNESLNYLKTDNARIEGQAISISSPAAGKLVAWDGVIGKKYNAGETIGKVEVVSQSPTGEPVVRTLDITIPQTGTIVTSSAVPNSYVAPGVPLAQAFDLDHLWVTANIKETDINDIQVGNLVDVYVDAYPGTTLSGKVDQIGLYTASTFSLLPSGNTSGNYTKVTQVIPVRITLDGYKGLNLVPGLNVTVRVKK
ncbi:HlyD family secretion protein [Thermicanus aegyptius]|uniref:HlyD family secretion protein n=1 Tax=Thermicanus aegyptius TaxID=94009 RepID=UPI00040651A9|nr:efflux RND transporter periplasmic adaptor subunit [Thermicanus aegyptius]